MSLLKSSKEPYILCPTGLWAPPGEWELETVGVH